MNLLQIAVRRFLWNISAVEPLCPARFHLGRLLGVRWSDSLRNSTLTQANWFRKRLELINKLHTEVTKKLYDSSTFTLLPPPTSIWMLSVIRGKLRLEYINFVDSHLQCFCFYETHGYIRENPFTTSVLCCFDCSSKRPIWSKSIGFILGHDWWLCVFGSVESNKTATTIEKLDWDWDWESGCLTAVVSSCYYELSLLQVRWCSRPFSRKRNSQIW